MPAAGVVEGFEVAEDAGASLLAGEVLVSLHLLGFEGSEKTFHGGIIIAVAFSAHAWDEVVFVEGISIIETGVLAASIGMVNELVGGLGSQVVLAAM